MLKMMGHSGNVPGAIAAEDVPKALGNLQVAIEKLKADASLKTSSEDAPNRRIGKKNLWLWRSGRCR